MSLLPWGPTSLGRSRSSRGPGKLGRRYPIGTASARGGSPTGKSDRSIRRGRGEPRRQGREREHGLEFGPDAGGRRSGGSTKKGDKEVNVERTGEALELNPDVIATGCPFCMTMMTDGVKHFNKEDKTKVMDVAELIANAMDL